MGRAMTRGPKQRSQGTVRGFTVKLVDRRILPGWIVPPVAGLARTTCRSRCRAVLASYSAVTAPWKTMLIVARRHSVRRGLADRLGTEHQSGGPLCSPREYALRELPHGVKGEGEM